jgi:ankyrin repeat protein
MSLRHNYKDASKYLINIYNQYNEIVNFDLDRPIHVACKYERYEEIVDLIKNNVNINIKNNLGETPLIIACIMNNIKIVKLLIENKANVTILSRNNKNLLQLVYSMRNTYDDNTELFTYLLDYNDINHRDITGNTISHYVCRFLDLRIFELLEKHNINYSITNNYNRNLLFELVIGYNNIVAKDLYLDLFDKLFDKIKSKVNLSTRDNYKKLAYEYISDNNIKNKIINEMSNILDNVLYKNNINLPINITRKIITFF